MASRDPEWEKHWHAVLTQWQRSEPIIPAFGNQRHLSKPTFCYRQRLNRSAARDRGGRKVERGDNQKKRHRQVSNNFGATTPAAPEPLFFQAHSTQEG